MDNQSNIVFRRRLRLLQLITGADRTRIEDLATKLNVSVRTIWRDLAAIRHAGLDVQNKRDNDYSLQMKRIEHKCTLTPQLWILAYLHNQAISQQQTSGRSDASAIWLTLVQYVPKRERKLVEQIPQHIYLMSENAPNSIESPNFETVMSSMFEKTSFRCSYRKEGMLVRPYALLFDNGWYLVAYTTFHKSNVLLEFNQIQDVEQTDYKFVQPNLRIGAYVKKLEKNQMLAIA